MSREAGMSAGQVIGKVDGPQVCGLDIARSVFQLHTVDMSSGEIVNQQLKRAQVLVYSANRVPCQIGMQAWGDACHRARQLSQQGHSVRLIRANAVRPSVGDNRTDAADARAIRVAIRQPGTKFAGMKTMEQQATLVLHCQRELHMKMKSMQSNALRGLLCEFGGDVCAWEERVVCRDQGGAGGAAGGHTAIRIDSLREPMRRDKGPAKDTKAIEARLAQRLRADKNMQRMAQKPGVGLPAATAAIATRGPASALKSGRESCAWLGQLQARRKGNMVMVAQAGKKACVIWAVTAKQADHQRGCRRFRPQAA